MSDNEPVLPSPVNAQLDWVEVTLDNRIRIGLKFDDGTSSTVEFAPDTEASQRVLDLFSELTTETLSRLAARGVLVTGFTPPQEQESEDDDE